LPLPVTDLPLPEVLAALAAQRIQSVLVEGGAAVFSAFLRHGLWDRLSLFIAPAIVGGGKNVAQELGIASMAHALRFERGTFRRIGNQMLFETEREHHVYRNN
jgi:diaminohydroxyphosphoribosylaminopyrimidine deaminase/5-amino-6-(5-phosphoribosylamino)uracil reductase